MHWTPGEQLRYLELSDEKAALDERLLAMERRALTAEHALEAAFRRGYRAGYCRQYGDSIPWDWEAAEGLVRAAEHWQLEEAEHWALEYMAKAHATPADRRTEAQAAALVVQRLQQDQERRLWNGLVGRFRHR